MEMFKNRFNNLLNKQMDRQDFIRHVAIGLVALTGFGTALKVLSPSQKKLVDVGYGNSAYGGDKATEKLG